MLTSTVIQNVNAVKTGKIYMLSGVVKSVNQNAPPCLKDGTFSTMFDIYIQNDQMNSENDKTYNT